MNEIEAFLSRQSVDSIEIERLKTLNTELADALDEWLQQYRPTSPEQFRPTSPYHDLIQRAREATK